MLLVKYKYIAIAIFGLLIIGGLIGRYSPRGISEEEHLLRVKYELLEAKANQLISNRLKRRKQNEDSFKKITADSIAIWSSSREYRDSIREYYNPR